VSVFSPLTTLAYTVEERRRRHEIIAREGEDEDLIARLRGLTS
jgi:hypothetical protein